MRIQELVERLGTARRQPALRTAETAVTPGARPCHSHGQMVTAPSSGVILSTSDASCLALNVELQAASKSLYPPQSISIAKSPAELGELAAKEVIKVANTAASKRQNAVIVLPTGSTPGPMYKKLIEEYKAGNVDFSYVTFFNLDEYIGLPKDHPLSYNYYMQNLLYGELEKDVTRKPKAWHVPYVDLTSEDYTGGDINAQGEAKVQRATFDYEAQYQAALLETNDKKADLVVLGIGGAYPEEDVLKGGHIGFNEPGTINEDLDKDRTKIVTLTRKTISDTRYRFRNIKYLQEHGLLDDRFTAEVPKRAITLGVGDILQSKKILLLANGEEKAPVIEQLYHREPSPDFPATYLKYHSNVDWILDIDAASKIPETQSPWQVQEDNFEWTSESIRQAIIKILKENKDLSIDDLTLDHFHKAGVSAIFDGALNEGLETIKQDAKTFLGNSVFNDDKLLSLMRDKTVLIISPHPDDDVICAGATIKKLREHHIKVRIAYSTNGEIAVRDNDARETYGYLADREIPTDEDRWRQAKIIVRQKEARAAIDKLGANFLLVEYLNQECYYRRGHINIDPISENDEAKAASLLERTKPDFIFYSAEHDSHGTHGHSTKTIQRALKRLLRKHKGGKGEITTPHWSEKTTLWGYRGAYNEWPLHENPEKLVIVPYDNATWDLKEAAIKAHKSQLNPMYPSFDRREFFERAKDRNGDTGKTLQQFGISKDPYAEAFRVLSRDEFLESNF